MYEVFKKALNQEQQDIVFSNTDINLVFAGAGTGKTRVILFKILYLLQKEKAAPDSFFITTFTNKAAEELRTRLSNYLKKEIYFKNLGTFHSLCAKILRKYADRIGFRRDFTIYDEDDSMRVLKNILLSEKETKIREYHRDIEFYKENHFETNEDPDIKIADIYEKYEASLKAANAFDFSDLLEKTILLFREDRSSLKKFTMDLKYIFVDEFQDTNLSQYALVKLLYSGIKENKKEPFILCVGDENQSIYGFRNANVENILNFPKDLKGTTVFSMNKNYRSCGQILKAASYLVFDNPYKTGVLHSVRKDPGIVNYVKLENDRIESEFIANELLDLKNKGVSFRDIAIFFRTNIQARNLEITLKNFSIPYIIVGAQKFYERKEIKDIIAYLKYLINPRDKFNLKRIVNTPKRGIGPRTMEAMLTLDHADMPEGIFERIRDEIKLNKKQVEELEEFFGMMGDLRISKRSPSMITRELVEKVGYYEYLKGFDENHETRIDNVEYLIKEIEKLEGLGLLLNEIIENMTLSSSIDQWEEQEGRINLMTLHLSKGLEFDTVFISGVEQGILPHCNSKNKKEFEEEQRLLYVGITRGKNTVYITRAKQRYVFGETRMNPESEFLKMIPKDELNIIDNTKDLINVEYIMKENFVKDENPFSKGKKVDHRTFGTGIIIDSFTENKKIKVLVHFYKYGRKLMISDYLEVRS